jgi:hypothetical protein
MHKLNKELLEVISFQTDINLENGKVVDVIIAPEYLRRCRCPGLAPETLPSNS